MIRQYQPLFDRETLAKEISEYILGEGWFSEYKKNEEFEKELASFLGVKYCHTVNNGTISLSLALLAHGVQPGEYVLVPNITMIATCNAVRLIGAKCVFIDVDERNLCMDLKQAEEQIVINRSYAKACIYVTLNGRSHPYTEYENFRLFCESENISLIEDNAQSLGSVWSTNKKISCPENGIGSFSFSMPKIITTGQGGCLVTNDEKLSDRIKKLKDFGRSTGGMDIHDDFGINSKFTEIQAIIGLNQMKEIDTRVVMKCLIYALYRAKLKNVKEVTFIDPPHVPWFVDIYVERRKELQDFLCKNDIQTRAVYPELTSQKVNSGCQIDTMKISGRYSQNGLWLPSSIDIEEETISLICNRIKEFYLHN